MRGGAPKTDEVRNLRASKLAEISLARYGLRDARLSLLRQGFKQVFRVMSPARGEFVLRMYATPPAGGETHHTDARLRTATGLRSPETLRAQVQRLSALARETDLLVPEPIPAADGTLVSYVSFADLPLHRALLRQVSKRYYTAYHPEHPGRHCVLFRWVPGRQKRNPTPANLSLVGAYAARLHRYAERYAVPESSALPRWDWHWSFGESAPLWSRGEAFYPASDMAIFEEAARRVREDLEGLGYGRDAFGFIHRDLNLDNVLFAGGRVGAIDFDLCGLGHYLLDLSATLVALERLPAKRVARLSEALFEGYESERSLPPAYRERLGAFAAMRKVAAVNRNLELRASPAVRHEARGKRFLRNAVTWLRENYL